MPRIFLTVREGDVFGRRVEAALASRFGLDNVLTNQTRMPAGVDIRAELARRVGACQVLLVVIGRQWAQDTRLYDPYDPVRLCVEQGLARVGLPLVPILTEGAVLPVAEELPGPIQALAYRTSLNLRDEPDFAGDIQRLFGMIDLIAPAEAPPVPRPAPPPAQHPPQNPQRPSQGAGRPPQGGARPAQRPAPPASAPIARDDGLMGGIVYILRLIRRLFGDVVGFFFSLIGLIIRQMLKSVIGFIMGIILFGLTLVVGFVLLSAFIGNDFDVTRALEAVVDQVLAIVQGRLPTPPDLPTLPGG